MKYLKNKFKVNSTSVANLQQVVYLLICYDGSTELIYAVHRFLQDLAGGLQ